MTTKYRKENINNVEVLNLDRNILLNDKQLKTVSKKIFNKNKIGKKLNKLNNVNYISIEKKKRLIDNAKVNNFFMLNGFADCYRKSIKISYVTLWRRLYKNKDMLKTLIDLKYIEVYQNKNNLDLKTLTDSKRYLKVKVFYDKRFEFIKFIKNNFLDNSQKKEKI